MTYKFARMTIQMQERNLRKVNGLTFIVGAYQYRLTWEGGFACFVRIDRREVGRRNYKYFSGVGAYHCRSVEDVLELVETEIEKKR